MESVQPIFTVRSVYAARDWYVSVFGFTTVFVNETPGEDNANYIVLARGKVGLHLALERDMPTIAGNSSCNFDTTEFDEMLKRARESGAPFHVEPGTIPTGSRTFGVQDPDGNAITFVEVNGS